MSAMPLTGQPFICIHGSLRRSCETCDLAERLEVCEKERDAALAERDAAVVRFHDWSGTDVPALNIALTAARQDAHEQRQRAEQAEAALTEARRVLREVQTPPGLDDPIVWAGVPPDWFTRRDAVLAQEEPS